MKKRRKFALAERQSYAHYNPKRVRKAIRLLKKYYEIEAIKNEAKTESTS